MTTIITPNQIKIRTILGHTLFIDYKQILPEHALQQTKQPNLPTMQCFTKPNCDCPTHAKCVPLAAKRIGLIYASTHPNTKHAKQVIIPFKRNEEPITRRIPPKRFGTFAEHDTPTMQQLEAQTPSSPNTTQNTPKIPRSPKTPKTAKPLQNTPKPAKTQKPAGETLGVTAQEKNLLLRVDAKDGEVVGGERLTAKETLRRLAYRGESEALGSEKVDRIWCLWVPRGFERLAVPFRVFRVNRDGLAWVLRQSEVSYIDPHPDFFAGMVMRSRVAPAPGDPGLG